MTDKPICDEAKEAHDMGEKPDLGVTPDALAEALSGTDSGSDTRAGSLQGGAATGSDDDPDSHRINADLAAQGRKAAASAESLRPAGGPGQPADKGQPGDDVDAPTG